MRKIVVSRGFRGYFGANWCSAMAQKQDLDHNILLYAFFHYIMPSRINPAFILEKSYSFDKQAMQGKLDFGKIVI